MTQMPERAELIVWLDSVNHNSGQWASLDWFRNAMTVEGLTHQSVGWVIHEDDVSVAICADRSVEDPDDRNVARVMQIPKAAIVKRRRLK